MSFDLPPLRIALYSTLGIFSLVLWCLTVVRLHYTTHLPLGDPLNDGKDFYDPIVAELFVASTLTIFWAIYAVYTIHKRAEHRLLSTFRGELIVLFILWVLYLVGAAIATSMWGNLNSCHQFRACRILTTLVAFSWIGWIVLTCIFAISLLFSISNSAMREPFHGRWDPRASNYHDGQRQMSAV